MNTKSMTFWRWRDFHRCPIWWLVFCARRSCEPKFPTEPRFWSCFPCKLENWMFICLKKKKRTWTESKKVRWNRSHDKVQILSASNKQHSVVLGEFSGTLTFLVGKFSFCRHISTYQISYEHRSWSPQRANAILALQTFPLTNLWGPTPPVWQAPFSVNFATKVMYISDQQWRPKSWITTTSARPRPADNPITWPPVACPGYMALGAFDRWDRGSEPKKSVSFLVTLSITTWKIWKSLLSTFIAKLHVSIHCLWAHPHELQIRKVLLYPEQRILMDQKGNRFFDIITGVQGYQNMKLHFPEQLSSENWWKNPVIFNLC